MAISGDNLRCGRVGLSGFLEALISAGPGRLAWVIAVQVGAGLCQAAGVLLLIPLLGAMGVGEASGVSRWTRDAFHIFGLRPTLSAVLGVFVAVSVATAALGAYQGVLSLRYRLEFVDALRCRLFSAIASAQWRHLMTLRQSDLLAVVTANVSWVGLGAMAALQILVTVILVGAYLAASIRISPALTGLAILAAAALIAVVWPLVRRSRRLGNELIERNRDLLGHTTGFLDGLKLVKAHGREHTHVARLTAAVTAARRPQIWFARLSAIAGVVQAALMALLLAVVVEVAVNGLHVPVGSVLVVTVVFVRVVSQLAAVQAFIQQLVQALPAFNEIVTLIGASENAAEAPASLGSRSPRVGIGEGVALDDVHFVYPQAGSQRGEALAGVSLELPRGSMVALTGPSGAGKTTTADLVAGLIQPTAGVVRVGGLPLSPERALAWRASIALVPQDSFLFNDTIEENLRWARPDATSAQLWQALEAAAAAEFVRKLPSGLESVVGDRGARLSGGERQRLALARALLRDPDLLILDEATNSLDAENESAVREALENLRGRTTILVIAHRLSIASASDQIVILDAGRVVEAGAWSELSQLPLSRLQALLDAGATPTLATS